MLSDVLQSLRCPLCAGALTELASGTGRALRCASGHSFDVARHGYVSLDTGRRAHAGDTAEMIDARAGSSERATTRSSRRRSSWPRERRGG